MTKQVLDKIKAISIHAPHAYAICMGIKKAEYRNKATNRRGWILIHASQSKESDEYFQDYGIDVAIAKRGAIIGAACITDCILNRQGGYAYNISRPILFETVIEGVKGCQSIFWGHCDDPVKIKAFEKAIELIGVKLKTK